LLCLYRQLLLDEYFLCRSSGRDKNFPGFFSGDWQSPEKALVQNLGEDATLGEFNVGNSAYPLIVSQVPEPEITTSTATTTTETAPPEEIIPEATTTAATTTTEEATTTEEVATTTEEIIEPEATTTEETVEDEPQQVIPEETSTTTTEATSTEARKPSFFVRVWEKIKNFFNTEARAEEATTTEATTTEQIEPVEESPQQIEEEALTTTEEIIEPEATTTEEIMPDATTTEPVATSTPEEVPTTTEEVVEDEVQQPVEAGDQRSKVLVFSDFAVAKEFENKKIKVVQLRISMAGKGQAGDALVVDYYYQDSWQNLAKFNLENEFSNALNSGYFLYALPIFETWKDLESFKIRFTFQTRESAQVYLDALWLEIKTVEEEEKKIESEEELPLDSGEQKFSLSSVKKNWSEDEEPEFKVEEMEKNLLAEIASAFEKKEITAVLVRPDGKEGPSGVVIQGNKIKITRANDRSFQPGLYKLKVKIKKGTEEFIQEQDFTWGVLAINTNKSIYLPGQKAYLQMAALRDNGHTICDANLSLTVIAPMGGIERPPVYQSGKCEGNNVTDAPDYYAFYQVGETGEYQMRLTNLDSGYEISDSFEVRQSVPFDIERIGPTRIYPPASYQVTLKIRANEGFSGQVIEKVPSGFEIISEQPTHIRTTGNAKEIIWNVEWLAGQYYELRYTFDAPDISPYLFLLGPLEIGDFQEIRQWQIASDELLSLYVDSVDVTAWTTVGTSPYLDAQDQPTNYIYSAGRNTNSGNYGFTDTAETGTINSVYLYIYAYGVSSADFTTFLSGTDTSLGPPTSWGWVNVDVSAILTSWTTINAATVMFDRINTVNETGVDAAYLYVDYTPVSNQVPTVSGVILNEGNDVTLTENATTAVNATATITDDNTYTDIATVTGILYRYLAGDTCTPDDNNCYADASCTTDGCSGNDCVATCEYSVQFHADPTATTSAWAAEEWAAWIKAIDTQSASGTATNTAQEIDVSILNAVEVSPSVDYGVLSPGESNDPLSKEAQATTTGNAPIDVNISGGDMCTDYPGCVGEQIATTTQQWASSSIAYDHADAWTLSDSAQSYELTTVKPTSSAAGSRQGETLYWGIEIAGGQALGTYSGINTLTAASD